MDTVSKNKQVRIEIINLKNYRKRKLKTQRVTWIEIKTEENTLSEISCLFSLLY